MGDKNLSVLFADDPREWFFKKKVRDYIAWRRVFSYTLPNLGMNGQTRSCGLSLYNFNAVDFPKETNGEKVLYNFYNFCDFVFKWIRDALSEPVIDLFHKKGLLMV